MNPQLGFCIGSEVCPGLSKLIEECGEVMQVAGKLIATGGQREHWDKTDLKTRVEDELADLWAAIIFYVAHNDLDRARIVARVEEKGRLFREWHKLQMATAAKKPEGP